MPFEGLSSWWGSLFQVEAVNYYSLMTKYKHEIAKREKEIKKEKKKILAGPTKTVVYILLFLLLLKHYDSQNFLCYQC